jgi:putative spermidine/putrescine transport system ATP-binding protein
MRQSATDSVTPTAIEAVAEPIVVCPARRPVLEVQDLTKRFGATPALSSLNFDVCHGEFLALLGPSGSGKTTVLRIIAGFEPPSGGRVLLNGRDVLKDPPYKRNIGVVFQNYALFPHMTVENNIAFPLKRRRIDRTKRRDRVRDVMELVGLSDLKGRYPAQMSGGQQQRVALARAIVFEPEILLLDEPLSALDKQLRQRMQGEIRALQRRLGITTIFVTHDQSEAMAMSDRVAVINRGNLEQIGVPSVLYERPLSKFVAGFLGESNLIEGNIIARGADNVSVRLATGQVVLSRAAHTKDNNVVVLVRPEKIALTMTPEGNPQIAMKGVIRESVYLGDSIAYTIDIPPIALRARVTTRSGQAVMTGGDAVWVHWAQDDSCVLGR